MEEYSLLVAYDTDGNEIQGKMKIVIKFIISVHILSFYLFIYVRDRAPGPFYEMLGQTQVNGWSRVIASQNGGSTSYISPLRLGVLQWSRYLFNYWKNKKTIIEKFLILLI